MGSFSIGDLYASIRLNNGQYLEAIDQCDAAAAAMSINVDRIGGSLTKLDAALVNAGFQTKEFQGYLNSLRAQGFNASEAVNLLTADIANLQNLIATSHANQYTPVGKISEETAAVQAAVMAERDRVVALMRKVALNDTELTQYRSLIEAERIRDAALKESFAVQTDYAALVDRLSKEETAGRLAQEKQATAIMANMEREYSTIWLGLLAEREAATKAEAALRVSQEKEALGFIAEKQLEYAALWKGLLAERDAAEKVAADARVAIEAGASARRKGIMDAELAYAARIQAEEAAAVASATGGGAAAGGIGASIGAGLGKGGITPRASLSSGPLIGGAVALFGGYEITKQAAEFQDAVAKVRAAIGGVSDDLSHKMADAALDLSVKVGISAKDIVAEFGTMSKAEVSLADQFKALPVLAQFAVATNTELDKSAKLVLTVMNTLKIPFSEVSHVTDQFTMANHLAIGSVDDFARALEGRAGAAFRAAKIPLNEALGMTIAFAKGGVEANIAQTALTQTVLTLTKSVKNHGDVTLEVAGKQVKWRDIIYNANGELNTMANVFQTLDKAFTGAPTKKITDFFQAIGVSGQRDVYVKSLLGMGDAIEQFSNQLANPGEERLKSFDAAMQSPVQQFKLMKEAIRDAAIELGASLLPVAVKGAEKIKDLANTIRELTEVLQGKRSASSFAGLDYYIGKALPKASDFKTLQEFVKASNDYANSADVLVKANGFLSESDKKVATDAATAARSRAKSVTDDINAAQAANDLYKKLSTTTTVPGSGNFDDPQADAKAEAKRLAAAAKAYEIKRQEITNDENAAKDKLKIELMKEDAISEVDEDGINKRMARLIKYNNDVLVETVKANMRLLEADKGSRGSVQDLQIMGANSKAIAQNIEANLELRRQAEAKITALTTEEERTELRIRKQQADEERRLNTQKTNDHIHALQLELEAIREHGTHVLEMAKSRAAFEESMGLITKAQRLKIDRETEADEFKLQSEAIDNEIKLLDGRQNRIGQKDEAIETKKQQLLNQRQKLEDQHAARKQATDQEELIGLDRLDEATNRLIVEQRVLMSMGSQSDRLIALKNLEIQTEALATVSRGLGGVYTDLADAFQNAMKSVGKTLAGAFLDPANFTKNWKSALKSIETELLGTFLQSLLNLGAAELISTLKIGTAKKAAAVAQIVLIKATAAAQIAADAEVATAKAGLVASEQSTILAGSELVALAQIAAEAAVGGAAAAASIAAIPIFGPGLALEAGQAMQAAILSTFAPQMLTFEKGGDVVKDTVALVHGGEHVINADLTSALKGMVKGGGFGGGIAIDLSGSSFGTGLTQGMVDMYMQSAVGKIRRSGGLATTKGRF